MYTIYDRIFSYCLQKHVFAPYIYIPIYMVLANPMYVYMCCIMESVNRTCYVSFMFLTCPAIFAFEWQIKRSRRGKTDFLT